VRIVGAELEDDGGERDGNRRGVGCGLRHELEARLGAGEKQRRGWSFAPRSSVRVCGADRAGQGQDDAADVLVGLRALLTLAPGRQCDPHAAERDHDEGADDGQGHHELEQGKAALAAPHRDAAGGAFSAVVLSEAISTPRWSPQRTLTSIWYTVHFLVAGVRSRSGAFTTVTVRSQSNAPSWP